MKSGTLIGLSLLFSLVRPPSQAQSALFPPGRLADGSLPIAEPPRD